MNKNGIEVKGIKGDIFSFSYENSTCCILWVKSGFNAMNSTWMNKIVPKLKEIKLYEFKNNKWVDYELVNRPWKVENGKLLKLSEAIGKLNYLYFLPNKSDTFLSDEAEIKNILLNALNEINEESIQEISINSIQSLKKEHDEENGNIMISTIEEWIEKNKNSNLKKIYLVDKSGGFNI